MTTSKEGLISRSKSFFNEIKKPKNLVKLGLGIVVLGVPLFHHQNSLRVFDALLGNTPDCSTIPSDRLSSLDAIAVLGGGESDGGYPNLFHQNRLMAAAELYNGDDSDITLIFLDGRDSSPEDQVKNKSFFLSHIDRNRDLPSRILVDPISFNTWTNLMELQKIMKKYELTSVVIITNAFHAARVNIMLCSLGLPYKVYTTEEILETPEKISLGVKFWEVLKLGSLIYDPYSRMSNTLHGGY